MNIINFNPTTYDQIHLADDEWDSGTMARIAAEHFDTHPACQFVLVYEHAGWFLGYRRDLTIWTTANDCAVLDGGPRPERWSGVCIRRNNFTSHAVQDSSAAVRVIDHSVHIPDTLPA